MTDEKKMKMGYNDYNLFGCVFWMLHLKSVPVVHF